MRVWIFLVPILLNQAALVGASDKGGAFDQGIECAAVSGAISAWMTNRGTDADVAQLLERSVGQWIVHVDRMGIATIDEIADAIVERGLVWKARLNDPNQAVGTRAESLILIEDCIRQESKFHDDGESIAAESEDSP